MIVGSTWEIPVVIDEPPLIVDSTQFYDDKKNTCSSVRDRKNKRIYDNSRVNKVGDCANSSGVGNEGCTVKIDPDETNKLADRKNGLYVPPHTWETLR